jgi:long-chain-fatty-acid--CoA ligase ACSBG
MGAIASGGIAAGIYPSDTPDQVFFKAQHSGSAIAVVENMEKANMFLARAGDLPALRAVVVWDPAGDFRTKTVSGVKLMHWSALMELGKGCSDEVLEARKAAQVPGNVCTYIYTSGTTGNPKAVMITHDNIVFIATVILKHFADHKILGHEEVEERLISYVPSLLASI